jgi:hypothetical protein
MPLRNRIACRFCMWRTAWHSRRVEKHQERAEYWSDRHLHYATKHLCVGKPNRVDVSDPPFVAPLDQRAREAGA